MSVDVNGSYLLMWLFIIVGGYRVQQLMMRWITSKKMRVAIYSIAAAIFVVVIILLLRFPPKPLSY